MLPVPPSANLYWRICYGRIVRTDEADDYRDLVWALLGRYSVLKVPVKVTVRWYRARKSGDLDNRLKVLFDALQGAAYVNDRLITEIHAYRFEDKENPRMEVEVEAV